MENKREDRWQIFKSIGLIITGWFLVMSTIVAGGAVFTYLVGRSPDMPHGTLEALYFGAIGVAIGWDVWLIKKSGVFSPSHPKAEVEDAKH